MSAPGVHGGAGLEIALGGAAARCRASGALWLEAERALIAADLHLEKGSAYAQRGQMLPPYDTAETLDRLEAEIAVLDPRLVVFLGDSFHDARAEARLARAQAERLASLARARTLVWLVGNHDAEGPRDLPGERVERLTLAGLHLVHEPTTGPILGHTVGEVAGHLHPCAKVRSRVGTVRRRCFVTDGRRLVMPAFGALAGGLNIRHSAFAPLFARPPLAAVLGPRRVHAVAWGLLSDD